MFKISENGYLAPDTYDVQNHLCVINCGEMREGSTLLWSKEQLQYYVSYILEDKPIDRMFGGFIFNVIKTREQSFIHPMFVGFGKPSSKKDWSMWVDILFARNANLNALYDAIGEGRKLDLWVTIPYPHASQTDFGEVRDNDLDFTKTSDRIRAIRWWLDLFLKRWQKEKHLHDRLALRGFVWQREAIDTNDAELVRRVNALIHRRHCLSMWLPNYGSAGAVDWRSYGFDLCAVNSNYYGNNEYDHIWINNASNFAKYYNTGMQINFGKGLLYNDTHHLDYFNLGLPEHNDYMNSSFLVYQLPNHTLEEVYRERFVEYIRLYTFIKGLYQRVDYPGIPY
jgi:hypothetical protein